MNRAKNFVIRRMRESEVSLAITWAAAEGWNPGLNDAKCFYAIDPNGFFIGLLDDEPIAVASAVCYDNHFSYGGLYIVKPEYRRQGYGMQLIQECLRYVGDRITGLDGVLNMVDKYAKFGCQRAYLISRVQATVDHIEEPQTSAVVSLTTVPFTELCRYDRELFPAPRMNFLREWITQSGGFALGYLQKNQLQGYAVIRPCHVGYKIGPLFADEPFIAEVLLKALLAKVPGKTVYLDIPEPNQIASGIAARLNLQSANFQVIRMFRQGFPQVDLSRIYGITTFEMG